MNHYAFIAYYEYNGSTSSNPLRTEKSTEEITFELRSLPQLIETLLNDPSIEVTSSITNERKHAIRIDISTDLDHKSVVDAMTRALQESDLFGNPL